MILTILLILALVALVTFGVWLELGDDEDDAAMRRYRRERDAFERLMK